MKRLEAQEAYKRRVEAEEALKYEGKDNTNKELQETPNYTIQDARDSSIEQIKTGEINNTAGKVVSWRN